MPKVTDLASRKPTCPYCGTVPTENHPDYTCPRIASVEIDDVGVLVTFLPPEDWEAYLQGGESGETSEG